MIQNLGWFETYARSVLRMVVGFAISLHGAHKLFDVFAIGGRRRVGGMALDALPDAFGSLEFFGGLLLLFGLFVRPVAALLIAEMLFVYFSIAQPKGTWPGTNSGQEASIHFFLLLYFAIAGAGTWSLDQVLKKRLPKIMADTNGHFRHTYVVSVVRVGIALLFIQHGLEKLWGFGGARVDHNFASLHGIAGPLEVVGGSLLILGLFTRATAFILCGQMAVVYFIRWVPSGRWLLVNGSEEAVLFCFAFLWLVFAGAGPVSLDFALAKKRISGKELTSSHVSEAT
jgi:putative oxidoreductase